MCCWPRSRRAIVQGRSIRCGARWRAPACSTQSCGVTSSRDRPCARCATARVQTCSCGRSLTSQFNISSTPQGRPNEQSPRARPAVHRGLLHHPVRHRVVGGAAREERELRLFPGQPGRRLVRGRREPVRLEHRQRAPSRVGGHGGGERARGRPLRVARLSHSDAARLALRSLLPQERRLYDAGVLGEAVQLGSADVFHLGVGHRLRPDEDERDALCRRRRDSRGHGVEFLHRGHRPHRRHRAVYHLRRTPRRGLHGGAAGHRADPRLHHAHRDRAFTSRRVRGTRSEGSRGLLLDVEADQSPRLPLDRDRLRRADPRHLVLVYRPAHCAACARREKHQRGAHRNDLRRVSEDSSRLHFRAARHRGPGTVPRNPQQPRFRVSHAGDAALAGRDQGPGARGNARGADELPGLRLQRVLHVADVGRLSQSAPRSHRAAARASGPHFRWCHGAAGLGVDSVYEVHLAQVLHLLAECPGLYRTADRGLLPAGPLLPPAQRLGRDCIADYRTRIRSLAPHSRAHEQGVGRRPRARHAVALDCDDQFPPLCGIAVRDLHFRALHREHDDSAAPAGENRGAHLWRRPSHSGGDKRREEVRGRAVGPPRGAARRALDRVCMKRPCVVRRASYVVLLVAIACRPSGRQAARPTSYDPAHDIGSLFADVQLSGIFPDSKEFVDARPRTAPATIEARYDSARRTPGFVLRAFVEETFILPQPAGDGYHSVTSQSMQDHIKALWPVLTRPPDSTDTRSSLIPLPNPYVVPGGRFREIYYWDSYFTMLGLVQSGRTDLVKDMLDNFAYLITTIGHIPNGNRTYYLTRSQPPYFAAMVGLYARATDSTKALAYLDALEKEYAFWMDGADTVSSGHAYRRVVRLPDGVVVNRYWDDSAEPRPESYRPDVEIGQTVPESLRASFYRSARATAESGWDFSSRWMRDPKDLRTLETTDLIPVDLNALLYNAELTIAALAAFRRRRGGDGGQDDAVARRFERQADARRLAILAMYDSAQG